MKKREQRQASLKGEMLIWKICRQLHLTFLYVLKVLTSIFVLAGRDKPEQAKVCHFALENLFLSCPHFVVQDWSPCVLCTARFLIPITGLHIEPAL